MKIRHTTGASALLLVCGLAFPWAALLTPWLMYPVIALPALFFLLNGPKGGILLNLGFIPLFVLSATLIEKVVTGTSISVHSGLVLVALLINIPIGLFHEQERSSGRLRLAQQLYRDPLTGLPNRKQLIADLKRTRIPVLFLINIDDFKEINNVFGPKAGDTILYELSVLIADIIKEVPCSFYKLGADEYALLMENSRDGAGRAVLTRLAETVSRSISAASFSIASSEIRLRATIGIGDTRVGGGDNIMAQADMALKTAKGAYKPYLFFTQTIDTRENYQKNIHSLRVLTEALENNRIVPYYMPIVSRITGKTDTYECLARLIDPDGTVYPPCFFLEIARKSRLYSQITRIMFRKAADYFNDLHHQFTVNISMDDMNDPETVSTILEILQNRPSLENRVIFEILESESINNYPQVSTFIQLVKAYGCKIAIDDFGSGYSNFEYIPRLNIDYLKINGELIRNIGKNRQNRFIVENIHNFASGLGIATVAEYVEDEEILKELMKIKVDYLQGYYFGAPAVTIGRKEVARIT
jgi:diguanylate cyclase (GGDEF)-like protein